MSRKDHDMVASARIVTQCKAQIADDGQEQCITHSECTSGHVFAPSWLHINSFQYRVFMEQQSNGTPLVSLGESTIYKRCY